MVISLKNIPIALGVYTVYKALTKDLKGTLLSVGKMGYTGVEFFGEPVYEPHILKQALQEAHLDLVGWQIEWRHLQPDTIDQTIDYCKKVGLKTIIIPCLGGKWNVGHTQDEECKEIWKSYIQKINHIQKQLSDHDIQLGYHNHEHEFILQYDGQTVFDLLCEKLSQEVIIELDTGNAIEGGANPTALLQQNHQREIFLHCKPFSHQNGFNVLLGEDSDENDWENILNACQDGNISYLIIEGESEIHEELQSAKSCLDALTNYIKTL